AVEAVLPRHPGESTMDWSGRVAELSWPIMRPANRDQDTTPSRVEPDSTTVAWFVDENMALLIRADGALDPLLDVVDRDRSQITEFLALRRGALTCIQRSTQRVLTERLSISRDQLAHWQNLV